MGTYGAFSNLEAASILSIDIGPFYSTIASYTPADDEKEKDSIQEARIQAINFDTRDVTEILNKIKSKVKSNIKVKLIGNDWMAYLPLIKSSLSSRVVEEDEITSMVNGFYHLLRNVENEVYTFHRAIKFLRYGPIPLYPCFLIVLDQELLIIKVNSQSSYEIIGRSTIGGNSFLTLASLQTNVKSMKDLLRLIPNGKISTEELMSNNGQFEPFSEHFKASLQDQSRELSQIEVINGILWTVNTHVAQVVSLYASQHNINKVFFGKLFLRNKQSSIRNLCLLINYWSEGKVQPFFMRHEHFLPVIGSFLRKSRQSESWYENYATSSCVIPKEECVFDGVPVVQLTLDRSSSPLVPCPLIRDLRTYSPDYSDLTVDDEARNYWLKCIKETLTTGVEKSLRKTNNKEKARMLLNFKDLYLQKLQYLKDNPNGYGGLSFRLLHETIVYYKREFGFYDTFKEVKQKETEAALAVLKGRLEYLDSLCHKEKHLEIISGILGGNIFDWGAQSVASSLDKGEISFLDAINKVLGTPCAIDDTELWVERIRGPAYKCAAIFPDNSGMDAVLGILPLARELIKEGTQVLLCANSLPTLNDVTHYELKETVEKASKLCPIIKEAIDSKKLRVVDSGQRGVCLDLSSLPAQLAPDLMNVDLLMIEGMARALLSNFNAQFSCDCLKVATIKDNWVAGKHGANMFAAICKFERSS